MRPLYNDSGFTLLEILVAITVLTIGAVGTTALTLTIIRGNAASNKITTATTLAQDKLEDVKRLGFAVAVSGTENYGTIANYTTYKRVTTVVGAPAVNPVAPAVNPVTNPLAVTVTVFWAGDTHRVTLNTILAQ